MGALRLRIQGTPQLLQRIPLDIKPIPLTRQSQLFRTCKQSYANNHVFSGHFQYIKGYDRVLRQFSIIDKLENLYRKRR